MKTALTAFLLLACTCLAKDPPPFLFPGAERIERDGKDWLVWSADGSCERAEPLAHAITFGGRSWTYRRYLNRWDERLGQSWVLSGSTWSLGRTAALHFNGSEATLIDSGQRYTWRASGDDWLLVRTAQAVPEGVNTSGTIEDMCSRKLANIRRQPRTKSSWINTRH